MKPKRTDSKDVVADDNLIKPMSASEVSKENNCKTIQDLLKEENQLSEKNNIRVNHPRAKKEKINQNTDSLLSTNGLVKIYDERRVVDGIDIKVKEREIVGLLGPNGAGKTTSFYMIVGLVRPDYGNVLFDSDDVTNLPMHIRARLGIGYLPQEESIFRKLTVYENIMAILETMNYSRAEMVDKCHSLMKRFGIDKLAGNKAITLSGGEKRRLTIARS